MIIKLDFRTKLFMTIVLSYVMVLGNIQTKYFVQAILISTIPIILLINAKYIRVAIIVKCTPKVGHKLTFGGVLFYE